MSPEPIAPAPSGTGSGPHWPALDGLRGLAVSAVMAYHLHHLSGGFLGVDLFFVLSGFLITSLLVREGESRGRINLGRFWLRRARRLLPALALTIVGVVVLARLFLDHRTLDALRGDALATAAYVANWHFAFKPVAGYFAADPSPLRHAWSLAIEEQYYLVWPFVVFGALAIARRLRVPHGRVVGVIAFTGMVTSAGWMVAHAGVWGIERLYLGSDTRVMAPLAGATLACVLLRRPELIDPAGASRRMRIAATAVAAICIAALAIAVVTVSATDEFLYRGGFALIAVLCAGAVTGSVLGGAGVAGHALSLPPLRWLGERSYGLYLYSWPIQVFAVNQGLDGAALTVTTLGLAGVAAEASYRWFEMPIRRGLWPGARSSTRTAPSDVLAAATVEGTAPEGAGVIARSRRRTPIAIAGIALLVIGVIVVGTVTTAEPDPLATRTDEEFKSAATRPPLSVPDRSTTTAPGGKVGPVRVLVVGDSVGYTLGEYAPSPVEDVASVDARALPGCSLIVDGTRPPAAVAAGSPPRYDDCAEAVAEADRLGLEGQPDVVLLVTGAWERSDHERDGRTVGPGDDDWTEQMRDLLDARIDRLSADGAQVALWAEPCGADEERRRRQRWYTEEVLTPVAAAREEAVVVSPVDVVCRDGLARDDIEDVGDPRPDDGQHWSEEGAAWLWHSWLGPTLRDAVARDQDPGGEAGGDEPPPDGTTVPASRPISVRVAGDSIAFTLDYEGADGAVDAGITLVPGTSTIGCGLVRDGRSWDGGRDLSVDCGGVAEREATVVRQSPAEITVAMWGAWEMAGASDVPSAGSGQPHDPAYDAYIRDQLIDRLEVLGSGGSTVVMLGVDCWPETHETRSADRVAWWRGLSRAVADELDLPYLDPTGFLCRDGQARKDIAGIGDPRPGDGAHWGEVGADWFWREWLGPQIRSLAATR